MIAADYRIDFSGAAGVANPESGAAMTPDTPYFIASITKMYTAAVILCLHEQGRVDLEAPISSYLPDETVRGSTARFSVRSVTPCRTRQPTIERAEPLE